MEATDTLQQRFTCLGDAVPMIMECLSHIPFRIEVSDYSIAIYQNDNNGKQHKHPEIWMEYIEGESEPWRIKSKHWPEVSRSNLDNAVSRFTMGSLAVKSLLNGRALEIEPTP